MTIDQKLNRLIELVEQIHEFNRHSTRQPSVKQLNDITRQLQALQGTRPQ